MNQDKGIKLQSLILLIVLPLLFLITGVYALLNYRTLYDTILDGFDRKLFAISTTSASFISGDIHREIKSEEDSSYQRYVKPMQRILAETGLTYHYTLVPQDEGRIMYILDATEGEDHSPAGTIEENPEDEAARLNKVMETKEASLSDIQEFDIWGQLKIGSAPIVDSLGNAVGLIGSDVNISVINAKLNVAMLLVFGIGVASFLLALWISLRVAKKLIVPINVIKGAALQVAAGGFGVLAEVAQPKELSELANAFNGISASLKENEENERRLILKQTEENVLSGIKNLFHQTALIYSLDNRNGSNRNGCKLPQLIIGSTDKPCGIAFAEELSAAYLGKDCPDELLRNKLSADIGEIVSRVLTQAGRDSAAAAQLLRKIAGADIEYFLLISQSEQSVRLVTPDLIHPPLPYDSESKITLRPELDNGTLAAIVRSEAHALN